MNNSIRSDKDNGLFAAALMLAALTGIFLRWYLLKNQILADDEWHGLYFAIGKSPFWLLTHFSIPGATCIPLNFYTWAVGAMIGWSEMVLRLPSLMFGILCVIVCPLLARQIIGARQAAWLALLLAISPVLIFYSRVARPYSAVAFLGFASLLFATRWAQSGSRRSVAIYVCSAILAVYFHLFAIVTATAPVLAAITYHLYVRFSAKQTAVRVIPSLSHWIVAGLAIAALSGLLMLPAIIHLLDSKFYNVAFTGTFQLRSLPRAAMLIAGTGRPVFVLLFWATLIAGAITQCRRNPWFGGMLLSLYPLHALALLLSRPDSAQSATVLVRYSIPLVPVSLLFVACGIQSALDAIAVRCAFRPALQSLTAFACATALAIAGPLPQIYASPNNFTNHGFFQQYYGRLDWSHSFYSDMTPSDFTVNTVIQAGEVSPFYKIIGQRPDGRPIVEYPMMIGDQFNPLYYYQYFHGRPVLVGYTTDVVLPEGLGTGEIYGDTYVDQVLSLVHDPSRLRFRNLISMDNLAAMRARDVEYIVLHKHFDAQLDEVAMPLPDLNRLYTEYREKLGAPVYEDAHLAVFGLSNESGNQPTNAP